MTFNESLKIRQSNFQANGAYHQNAMPEVYEYYKQFVATGKYPYLAEVEAFILTKETIDSELKRYLETEVYLASSQFREEKRIDHKAKMLLDGWLELTKEVVIAESKNGNKIRVNADVDGMLSTSNIENVYKPVIDNNGWPYLMKTRATRKGYPLHHFNNAFYKVVV
jgi:hypothetical protein